MEKGFLDLLYVYRMDAIKALEYLHGQVCLPQQKCCDDMPDYNLTREQIKSTESELSMLDSLITAYINTHKKK